MKKGLLIVNTGDGKGKSTAAFGMVLRAWGRGFRICMIQFIKGPWKSGEDEFAEYFAKHSDNFLFKKMGLGFVGILGDTLPREEHEKAARKALEFFSKELQKTLAKLGFEFKFQHKVTGATVKGKEVTVTADAPDGSKIEVKGGVQFWIQQILACCSVALNGNGILLPGIMRISASPQAVKLGLLVTHPQRGVLQVLDNPDHNYSDFFHALALL